MQLAHTRHDPAPTAPDDAVPIVLLHGLGGTQAIWRPIVEPLRELGAVITLDLPGFGRSADASEWTLSNAADSIVDTLDELAIERCVLVGHSLGGGVAIRTATTHPDRVASLVLVSPAGFAGTGDGVVSSRLEAIHAAWRLIVRVGSSHLLRSDAVRDRIFAPLVHDTSVIGAREAAELARGSARGRGSVAARAAILAVNLRPELPSITQPTELVWGRQDRIVPFRYASLVARAIPNAHGHWLDGVGHMPMWERPQAVIDAVASAARALSSATAP